MEEEIEKLTSDYEGTYGFLLNLNYDHVYSGFRFPWASVMQVKYPGILTAFQTVQGHHQSVEREEIIDISPMYHGQALGLIVQAEIGTLIQIAMPSNLC